MLFCGCWNESFAFGFVLLQIAPAETGPGAMDEMDVIWEDMVLFLVLEIV